MFLAVLTASDRCSQGLATDTAGPAVIVIQHVDEHMAQGMADWLGAQSALPVRLETARLP